jgi:hypothetical protein
VRTMGKVIVKPPNYAIPIRRRVGDRVVEGWFAVFDGIVTVWHPDGRTNGPAPLGTSSDEGMALHLLLELEREHSPSSAPGSIPTTR